MRIVAGAWRGRTIAAPRSEATRPTADRVRQALFDMLSHAPWAEPWPGCSVLDAFAGSGALGLEALSRGAERVVFFDNDRAASATLRDNIAVLGAAERATLFTQDAIRPPVAAAAHANCRLVFLDPPYGKGLVGSALAALRMTGWIAEGALVVAETARDEPAPVARDALLADRSFGAARISIWRV